MRKYTSRFIAIGIVILLITWIFIRSDRRERSLKKNGILFSGKITDVIPFPRGSGIYLKYDYTIGDSKYSDKVRLFIESKNVRFLKPILIGVQFPLLYDSVGSNNQLLIRNADYKYWGYRRPDSLTMFFKLFDSLNYAPNN